jgi:SAM-dependent methyltransferase
MSDNPNTYYYSSIGVSTYDLFAGSGALAGDIEFYLACARRFKGPILELGTGTGRITIPLAKAHHRVVGMDLSPTMLKLAVAKRDAIPDIADRVTFIEGDMKSFDLNELFSLILVPARSFQHLITPADQRSCLTCIRRHLGTGGHVVIDLFDPNFELIFGETAPPSPEVADSVTGSKIRRSVVARNIDPWHQIIEERLRFDVVDEAEQVVRSEETTWKLRWSVRQEIAYLLELCGFEEIQLFSNSNGAPPAYGREQLWLARAC